MKSSFKLQSSLLACGSLLAASQVFGQLTWDANNTGGGQTDGGGTWLNANQWWNGASNVNWSNGTPDNAIIGNGGAGGTITVGSVTAGTVLLDNFSGTYTFDGTAGSSTINQSGGITIGANAGNVRFRNTAIAGSGGVTMNGSGTLILGANPSAPHTYTGQTVVNAGVVMFFDNFAPGNMRLNNGMITDYYRRTNTFSGLGTGNNQIQIYGDSGFGGGNGNSNWRIGAQNSVLQWGSTHFDPTSLKFLTFADNMGASIYGQVTFQNGLDLNGAARTIQVREATGVNAINNSWARITGVISGASGTLVKTGGGNLRLQGNNTYGGGTTINEGAIIMENASALGSTSGALTVNGSGLLILNNQNLGVGNLTGTGGTITNNGANNRILTIGNGDATGGNFQGNIADNTNGALGTLGLTKTGAGTITLSGANTYTGATTVSEGTLIIDGSTSSTSVINVSANGILAGSGTAGGATTITGGLNPGNSPGVMTFGSSLILESTATTTMEIDGTTLGTEYDHVDVAGQLTYGGELVLDIGTVFGAGTYDFNLFDFETQTGDFDSVTLADLYSGSLNESNGEWSLTDGDNTWTFSQSTGDLNLVVLDSLSAIPEPHTALLSALGLLALLRRRR